MITIQKLHIPTNTVGDPIDSIPSEYFPLIGYDSNYPTTKVLFFNNKGLGVKILETRDMAYAVSVGTLTEFIAGQYIVELDDSSVSLEFVNKYYKHKK